MKQKILFVSFYFLPYKGIGVRRLLKFRHYLDRSDNKTIVLAPERDNYSENGAIFVRLPRLVKRLASVLESGAERDEAKSGIRLFFSHLIAKYMQFTCIPDRQIFWVPYAVFHAIRLVQREKVNVIYTTSPPESSHFIGLCAKLFRRVTWIAEFRDTWIYDPLNPVIEKSSLRRTTDSFLEKLIVRSADGMVVNSKVAEGYFRDRYFSNNQGIIATIYRGYDQTELPRLKRKKPRKGFLVVHTGNISRSHYGRSIVPFIQGLVHAISQNPKLRDNIAVFLIGNLTDTEKTAISMANLDHMVQVLPEVPYAEALAYQRSADLLLLINHPSAQPSANIPGKLFEYIGMNKPILAITTEGAVKDLVSKYGGFVASPLKPEEIGQKISIAYDLYTKGRLLFKQKPSIRQQLRTDKMAIQLIDFIESVTGRQNP